MENENSKKKTTAPDTSVGADDGQPLHNSTENSISAFEEEIKDERFLRCHQSYLVNLQYVAGLIDSDFIMLNDNMIPIRKSGRKLIVKKYEEYLKDSLQKENDK